MHEKLFLIGMGLIFVGIFVTVVASFLHGKGKIESGGAFFIGPIPIIFGTSKKMLYLVMVFSLIVFILFLIFGRKLI